MGIGTQRIRKEEKKYRSEGKRRHSEASGVWIKTALLRPRKREGIPESWGNIRLTGVRGEKESNGKTERRGDSNEAGDLHGWSRGK